MSAIYSGALWNSTQVPEANAVTRRRSRNENSCDRDYLVPSRVRIRKTRQQELIRNPGTQESGKGLRVFRDRGEAFTCSIRSSDQTSTIGLQTSDISAAPGIHQRAEIRKDQKRKNAKTGVIGVTAIIEGKIMNLSVETKVAIAVATSFVVLIVGAMAQG
jgi:hypothetical protein